MTHILKYTWKCLLHNKSEIIWVLLFPIALGSLFKIAFSNISSAEAFQVIPVAIVCDESESAQNFKTVADELGKTGDDQMLDITYCDDKEAKKLLEDKDVDGILYASEEVTLTVSANMKNAATNQSILESFVSQYNMSSSAIADIAKEHPEQLMNALDAVSKEVSFNQEVTLTKNSTDTYSQYFYNLIAMSCLFTSTIGLLISVNNQGNLSALGARKNVSPTNKMKTICGELIANIVFQFGLNLIGYLFMLLVLKVDVGSRLPLAILTIFISCLTGVTLGFFIGAFGSISSNAKEGIAVSITLSCCFFSGLMMGNMRMIIDMFFPIFNHINPAALISDSFYSLANYDTYTRYTQNIATLLLLAALFTIGGFLLTRRKKYASL